MKRLAAIAVAFLSISASFDPAPPVVWAVSTGPGLNDVRGLPTSAHDAEARYGSLPPEVTAEITRTSEAVFAYLSAPQRGWRGPTLSVARLECAQTNGLNVCRRQFDPVDAIAFVAMCARPTIYDPFSLGSAGERQFAVEMIACRTADGSDQPGVAMVFVLAEGRVTSILFNVQPWIQLAVPPRSASGGAHG